MEKKIYIFDIIDASLFNPITETRPAFDLLCGIYSYYERFSQNYHIDGLIVRDDLIDITKENYPEKSVNKIEKAEQVIFLSGLAAISESNMKVIMDSDEEIIYHSGEDVIAMVINFDRLSQGESSNFGLQELASMEFDNIVELDIPMPKGIWDLPLMTGAQIINDFMDLLNGDNGLKTLNDKSFDNYEIRVIEPNRISLGDRVKIEPFVILDATDGPIVIGDDVEITTGSQLRGPLFIGNHCKILTARISGGCSVGPLSRMGGEIEQSIVQGYSNKYHDGFLGHSYLGKWVNLGALTTNSDLKNNYGEIKYGLSNDEAVKTDSIKVGAFLGDHTKTGIGTLINSGSSLGAASNFFGGGMTPKYLKPFSWGSEEEGFTEYKIDKAIETAKKVALRRNIKLGDAEISLLKKIHGKYWP